MKQYKHFLNWEKMLFIAHVTVFYHQSMTAVSGQQTIRLDRRGKFWVRLETIFI